MLLALALAIPTLAHARELTADEWLQYAHVKVIRDFSVISLSATHVYIHMPFDEAVAERLVELKELRGLRVFAHKASAPLLTKSLAKLQNLERLDLMNSSVVEETAAVLGQMPKLRHLVLCGTGFSSAALASLAQLTALESLDFGSNEVTPEHAKAIGSLASLRSLQLGGARVAPDAWGHLVAASLIVDLDISQVEIEPSAKEALGKALSTWKVESLNVSSWWMNDIDHIVSVIAGLSKLRTLYANDQLYLSDEHVRTLLRMQGIERLSLRLCPKITDAAFVAVAKATSLRTIDLTTTRITDVGVQALTLCTGLTSLDLSNCAEITDRSLDAVCASGLVLTELGVAQTKFLNGGGLARLTKRFPDIQALDIGGCSGTDMAGLAAVVKLGKLRRLTLDGLPVVDNHLLALAECKTLKYLSVAGCRTQSGAVAKALDSRTDLRVQGLVIVE